MLERERECDIGTGESKIESEREKRGKQSGDARLLKMVDVIGGKHTLTHKPADEGFRVERGARGDKKLCDGVLESDFKINDRNSF